MEISNHILSVSNKKEERFLKQKTKDFDFQKFGARDIIDLLNKMKKAMHLAHGIGLSANQIGLEHKIFIAEVPTEGGGKKFYALFNPSIEKLGNEKIVLEEGCLSVPGTYGRVERSERITIKGYDKRGRPLKMKAWGLLARVFQHEIDHLNGLLFLDRTRDTYAAVQSERLKKREGDILKKEERK